MLTHGLQAIIIVCDQESGKSDPIGSRPTYSAFEGVHLLGGFGAVAGCPAAGAKVRECCVIVRNSCGLE